MKIPSEKIYEYPLDKYLKPQQKPSTDDLILENVDTTAASLDKLLSRATSVLKNLDNISKSFKKLPRKVKLSEPFGFDELYDEETNVREIVDAKINGNIIVGTTRDKKENPDGNLKKIAEIYDREMDDLISKFVKNFKMPILKESVILPSTPDSEIETKKFKRIVTELKNLNPPSLQRHSNELIEIKSSHQNSNKLAIRKLPPINIKPGLTEQKIPTVEILPTEILQKVVSNVAVVTCKDSKGEKSVYQRFKMCEKQLEKTQENEIVSLFENKPCPGPSRTEPNALKPADYVPYSKLTVGGVSIDELQDEINKLYGDDVSADLPISPIVQKILSEKSNNTEDYADDFDDKSSTVEDKVPVKSAINLSIKTSTDVFDFVHNRDVRDGATQSNVARVQKETQTSVLDNEFGTQTSPSKAKSAMTSPARNTDALTSPAFKIRNAEQQTSPFVSERASELKLLFPMQSTDSSHSDDFSAGEIASDFKKISDKYQLETRSRSSDSCTSVSSSSVAAIRMNGKSDGEMSVSHGRIF